VLELDDRPGGTVWQVRAVNVLPNDPVPTGPRLSTVELLLAEYRALRDGRAGKPGQPSGTR